VNLGLDGKVALVCGGSRGIGRAIAEELAAEGAAVGLCARDPSTLAAAVAAMGPGVLAIAGDLSVAGEGARVVEACRAHFGQVDILVANGGGPPAGPSGAFGRAEWDRAVSLLLTSTVELAAAVLPEMRKRGWGRILAVTSIAASQPVDNLILSNSLRPAVTGFAASLAREVAKDGITVNTLLPGWTATERVLELVEAGAQRDGIAQDEVRGRIEADIPLGRLAEPREVAGLAAFLVSERASYITGRSFPVDGGWIRGLL